jgi:hypothetical protein
MRSHRHTGRMLLLLIAIAVCALGLPKQQSQAESSLSQLGDGVGRFERIAAHEYAGRFAPGAESITAPDESTQETADASGSACTLDQIADAGCSTLRGSAVLVSHQSPVTISSGDRYHPSQRGPPLLLN